MGKKVKKKARRKAKEPIRGITITPYMEYERFGSYYSSDADNCDADWKYMLVPNTPANRKRLGVKRGK